MARVVIKWAPELADAVLAGAESLDRALNTVSMRPMPALVPVGHAAMSPTRPLSAMLRADKSAGPKLDIRFQISKTYGWHSTSSALRVEVDCLPELLAVLGADADAGSGAVK